MLETSTKSLELDGQNQNFDSSQTFGSIAQEIKSILGPDRVMTEILVDDRPIGILEEEKINSELFKNMGRVVIRSRAVNDLFLESLQMAPQICEALQADSLDIANLLEKNEINTAQERIGELTSLVEWLLQLLGGSQSFSQTKLEDMKYSGGKIIDTVNRMQFLLAKLHLHMSSEQWKEFTGVLKTEFITETKIWEVVFHDLAKNFSPRSLVRGS